MAKKKAAAASAPAPQVSAPEQIPVQAAAPTSVAEAPAAPEPKVKPDISWLTKGVQAIHQTKGPGTVLDPVGYNKRYPDVLKFKFDILEETWYYCSPYTLLRTDDPRVPDIIAKAQAEYGPKVAAAKAEAAAQKAAKDAAKEAEKAQKEAAAAAAASAPVAPPTDDQAAAAAASNGTDPTSVGEPVAPAGEVPAAPVGQELFS